MKAVWLLVGCVACGGGPNFVLATETAPIVVDAGEPPDAPAERGATGPTGDAGPMGVDATPDAAPDAPTPEAATAVEADGAEAAADAGVDAPPQVDAQIDAAPDAPVPGCTPIPSTISGIGGCGGSTTTGLRVHIPEAWCQYIVGSKTPIEFGDSWAAMPTPPECQCMETLNCSCIFAHFSNYCPIGTTFITCNNPTNLGTPNQGGVGIMCHG